MEFSDTDFNGPPPIEAYGDGGFRLDKKRVEGSMILLPLAGMFPWAAENVGDMVPEAFEKIITARDSFDLILIGTGRQIEWPSRGTRDFLAGVPMHFEIMDTGAACRTYNVLLGENRRVAAALLSIS